ncbi:uncharacterized protein LAESUDRAFT_600727, partial [Laetiporus sulphureus 93-53]
LRNHIRKLLFDYALTHLTTDYVAWTHDAVSELLSDTLQPVSTTISNDPFLPVEPLDVLLRRWGTQASVQFEENW